MNIEKHSHHHSKYDPVTGKKIESDDLIDEIRYDSKDKNMKIKNTILDI